jgi:DNA-binding FadR family transcriptional regulator
MLERIKAKMLPFGLRIEAALPELYLDHQRLLDALRAHDPDRAENAFRAHNERVIHIITEGVAEARKQGRGPGAADPASPSP